jgi:hypothetical protein
MAEITKKQKREEWRKQWSEERIRKEWSLWIEELKEQERDELVEYLETIKNNEDKLKEITLIEIDNTEPKLYLADKPLLLQAILSELLKIVLRGDINDWDLVKQGEYRQPISCREISIDPAVGPWEGVESITLYFQTPLDGVSCEGKSYSLLLQACRFQEAPWWSDDESDEE